MSSESSSQQLFKHLTVGNWLDRDLWGSHIISISPSGETSSPTGDGWASMILSFKLSPDVPSEIVELFEVARGALCYGYFFYPLYTLGFEQLHRVADAAVKRKCELDGAPSKIRSFENRIDWLFTEAEIDEVTQGRLHAGRWLRNSTSHPDRQMIVDQTMAIRDVEVTVELINLIFEGHGPKD